MLKPFSRLTSDGNYRMPFYSQILNAAQQIAEPNFIK